MWIAVNEDGVSILDHHTMVCEGKAGSTLLKHLSYLPCSGLRGLNWPWSLFLTSVPEMLSYSLDTTYRYQDLTLQIITTFGILPSW